MTLWISVKPTRIQLHSLELKLVSRCSKNAFETGELMLPLRFGFGSDEPPDPTPGRKNSCRKQCEAGGMNVFFVEQLQDLGVGIE